MMLLRPTHVLHAARAVLTLLVVCAVLIPSARAATYTYNTGVSQRTVNVGILLIDSTTSNANPTPAQANPDPYVFYALSQRPDVMPYGWSLVNPIAPKTVTADMVQRYPNATPAYTIGQSLTPNMAAYWEVRLSRTASSDLQQFNVLLIDLKGSSTIAQFGAGDQEKLRQFVDGGGTLWIEGGKGATISTVNGDGLFFSGLQFATGTAISAASPRASAFTPLSGAPRVPSISALLSAPYFLQQPELDTLPYTTAAGTGDTLTLSAGVLTPVLTYSGTAYAAEAGSYGAGAIVATSTGTATIVSNAVTGATNPVAANPSSTGLYPNLVAPNLKFLVNIMAWGGGHPGEAQGSHHNGTVFNSFPSPVRVWTAPVTGSSAPPAPAIYGSLAFVTDAAGVLHALVLNPGTLLSNPYTQPTGVVDNGTSVDYSQGKSYDEVWHTPSLGANVSAPAVAADANGNVVVLVETDAGAVKAYNASSGAAVSSIGSGSGAGGSTFSSQQVTPAPAPTLYNGSVYAAQTDNSLYVYNLFADSNADYKALTSAATPAPVPTGAPAVGIIPVDATATGVAPTANDILAMLPTTQGLYSIFLGSRGEQLRPTGLQTEYLTKLQGTAAIDSTTPVPPSPLRVYTQDAATGYPMLATVALNTSKNGFTGLTPGIGYFADYDTDLTGASATSALTRTIVNIANTSYSQGAAPIGLMSAPAMDRFGNAVYITNAAETSGGANGSSLVSFHDSPTNGNVRLNWRFRLPIASDKDPITGKVVDADGADYTSLIGFTFQGAPVADETGNVYALATNGGQLAIICINGLAPVTTASVPGQGQYLNIMQTDEGGNMVSIGASQYTQPSGANPNSPVGGPLTLTNFGTVSGGQPQRTLNPTISEPQGLTVSFSNAGTATPFAVALHTNVAWFTILAGPTNPATPGTPTVTVSNTQMPSGLTKAGNALFFVDGAGHLFSVIASPGDAGIPIVGKTVSPAAAGTALPPLVVDYGVTGTAGAGSSVSVGAPSIADGALVVSGAGGIAGFANRVTLVADSSRLIELTSGGEATWVADATTGVPPGTAAAYAGQPLASSMDLNRPSSVTELTANDYLVADTGNNRCVRFDRSGKVKWELSRFSDAYNIDANGDDITQALFGKTSPTTTPSPGTLGVKLLAPSEPDTLNQPTSVQIYSAPAEVNGTTFTDPSDPKFTPNYTIVHYLVSDSGNDRILDIVDVFDNSGSIVGTPHNLVWMSHTHDKQQRDYRYQSAAFFSYGGSNYVSALVTNTRIPSLGPGKPLSPAAQDTAGGSIVLLNRLYKPLDPTDGLINQAQSQFHANLTATGTFDLTTTPSPTTGTVLYIRNPRYLKVYVPQDGKTDFAFLLADDNGVFDLAPANGSLQANWGFTQKDYQAVTLPIDSAAAFSRALIPFVPTSIQRLGADKVGAASYGRYLVTNSYSEGEASVAEPKVIQGPNNTNPTVSRFGGEVLELAVGTGAAGAATNTVGARALSRPTNTSPLIQPAFAFRVP